MLVAIVNELVGFTVSVSFEAIGRFSTLLYFL